MQTRLLHGFPWLLTGLQLRRNMIGRPVLIAGCRCCGWLMTCKKTFGSRFRKQLTSSAERPSSCLSSRSSNQPMVLLGRSHLDGPSKAIPGALCHFRTAVPLILIRYLSNQTTSAACPLLFGILLLRLSSSDCRTNGHKGPRFDHPGTLAIAQRF